MHQKLINKVALFAVGGSSWQGGIQYITNFLAGLNIIARNQDSNITVLLFKANHQHFVNIDEFTFVNIDFIDLNTDIPQVGLIHRIHNYARFRLFKLNYSPRVIDFLKSQKVEFVFPLSLPISSGLNSAGWVADFQHRNFPKIISAEFTQKAENWISAELKFSSKIVLSSETCRKDCYKFFPGYLHKIVVMPFAVYISKSFFTNELLVQTRVKYDLKQPFFIISNLFAVTKNHKVVFDALGILRRAGVEINVYCTGNIVDERDIGYANEILKFISLNGISSQVHLLGLIPREDQISLYRLSLAMIQPSLSEGWSTCVEEAKNLGKDMLLSDIDVHREQWPNNPWFFQSTNSEELAVKMLQLFELNKIKIFPDLDEENQARRKYENNLVSFADAIQKVVEF